MARIKKVGFGFASGSMVHWRHPFRVKLCGCMFSASIGILRCWMLGPRAPLFLAMGGENRSSDSPCKLLSQETERMIEKPDPGISATPHEDNPRCVCAFRCGGLNAVRGGPPGVEASATSEACF